jgi:hypothetical protein
MDEMQEYHTCDAYSEALEALEQGPEDHNEITRESFMRMDCLFTPNCSSK